MNYMKRTNFFTWMCGATFLLTTVIACGDDSKQEKEPEDPNLNPAETFYPGEVKPHAYIKCFAGAYYRKVVSSKDYWTGIKGKVTLPVITFDENRKNPAKPQQYLDNPSVYMGGNANGQETDIGMTWEVIRDENGVVSPDRRAFRPFLRRTGYTPTGQTKLYINAPAESRYYWYEGDEITMSLEMVRDGVLLFIVEGENKRYKQEFECAGYRFGSKIEFKRVNAIDQVSNEGKPAQPTKTMVENSTWHYTNLLRDYKSEIVESPMHEKRFTNMRCPDIKHFKVETNETALKKGGEVISIYGQK